MLTACPHLTLTVQLAHSCKGCCALKGRRAVDHESPTAGLTMGESNLVLQLAVHSCSSAVQHPNFLQLQSSACYKSIRACAPF